MAPPLFTLFVVVAFAGGWVVGWYAYKLVTLHARRKENIILDQMIAERFGSDAPGMPSNEELST